MNDEGDGARGLPAGAGRGAPLSFDFEGQTVRAFAGESVAVALLAGGVRTLGRSAKYHRPRGAFCFDGHCASCYLRIDGRPNRRACLTPAVPGLRCERQNAFPSADVDLLTAADWLFPGGMDHHTLMTGTRLGNRLFLKLVRQMGGSGTLPDPDATSPPSPPSLSVPLAPHSAAAPSPSVPLAPRSGERVGERGPLPSELAVDLCIVGAGPAGLAAARTVAASPGRPRVLLVDEQPMPGGSLLAEPGGSARAAALAAAATAAGATLLSHATAIAFYPEDPGPDGRPGVLAVATPDRLLRISARRYLYATGAYDQNLPFADNDRPGIISARACGRLAFHHGVRPAAGGGRIILLGGAPYAFRLAAGLAAAGLIVDVVDLAREQVVGARGGQTVRGLDLAPAGDPAATATRTMHGDLVAVGVLPAPASELPRQHGADVVLDPARGGFAVNVDSSGACAPAVYACGDVTGYRGPDAALDAGLAAGQSIAADL